MPGRKKREAKRRLGRPKLPEGELKSERIVVHVSKGDLATLVKEASARDVSVGQVAREILERSLRRRK